MRAKPAEITAMDAARKPESRRVAPRYPASVPCVISWEDGDIDAMLLDLSLSGAAVVVPVVPDEMKKSALTLTVEDGDADLDLLVKVVRVEKEPFGGWLLRLKFDQLAFDQAKALTRLVTELRMEFNQRQVELATDRLGRPFPSHYPQYPPRDRQK